jgi:sulfur dioxygenase
MHMLFRQLIEADSSTYTYLIACSETPEAVLLDPVLDTVERDLQLVQDLELLLIATLETHVRADHLTGSKRIRRRTGCKIAYPAMHDLPCAEIGVSEGKAFNAKAVPALDGRRYGFLTRSPSETLQDRVVAGVCDQYECNEIHSWVNI